MDALRSFLGIASQGLFTAKSKSTQTNKLTEVYKKAEFIVNYDAKTTHIIQKEHSLSEKTAASAEKVKVLNPQKLSKSEQKLEKKVDEAYTKATKGLIEFNGRLFAENPRIDSPLIGISAAGLRQTLKEALKTDDFVGKKFKITEENIQGEMHSHEFIVFKEKDKLKIYRQGEFFNKGACGEIFKASSLSEQFEFVLKQSENKDRIKNDKKTLSEANSSGDKEGIQKPHKSAYVIEGKTKSKGIFGLVSYKYDGNLEELLNQTQLSASDTLFGIKQIMAGAAHLKKKKLGHLDIKFPNIFIKKDENGKYAMHISDFDGVTKLTLKRFQDIQQPPSSTPGLSISKEESDYIGSCFNKLQKAVHQKNKKEIKALWKEYKRAVNNAQAKSVAKLSYNTIACKYGLETPLSYLDDYKNLKKSYEQLESSVILDPNLEKAYSGYLKDKISDKDFKTQKEFEDAVEKLLTELKADPRMENPDIPGYKMDIELLDGEFGKNKEKLWQKYQATKEMSRIENEIKIIQGKIANCKPDVDGLISLIRKDESINKEEKFALITFLGILKPALGSEIVKDKDIDIEKMNEQIQHFFKKYDQATKSESKESSSR